MEAIQHPPDSLGSIADMLQKTYPWQRVSLNKEGVCCVDATLIQTICDFILYYLPCLEGLLQSLGQATEPRNTLAYLNNIFGKNRVIRICNRYNLDFIRKTTEGMPLTVYDIKHIFVGTADIRRKDVEELKGKRLEELSKDEIDEAYNCLIPFKNIEDIFLKNVPVVRGSSTRGDNPEGRKNRVFLMEQMRRDPHKFSILGGVKGAGWHIRIAKRIVHETLPPGVLIYHPDGYFVHQEVLKAEGAFAVVLKCVTKTEGLRSMISLLSTRTKPDSLEHLASAQEPLHRNIGAKSAIAIYPYIQKVLKNPLFFESQSDTRVDLQGYSLGAAQAIRIAAFMQRDCPSGTVATLTTIAPAGADKPTLDWLDEYAEKMNQNHYVWLKDAVSLTGAGLPCGRLDRDVHVTYLGLNSEFDVEQDPEKEVRPLVPETRAEAFKIMFLHSLLGVHREESIGLDHEVVQVHLTNKTPEKLRKYVRHSEDPRFAGWEKLRTEDYLPSWGDDDHFITFLNPLYNLDLSDVPNI